MTKEQQSELVEALHTYAIKQLAADYIPRKEETDILKLALETLVELNKS